ncbi:MAG: dynamin, partial [Acaryochloridaceae cyanobacterium RL_2_7]|nr:dynamin [Acaryochloridaceae cyanobacterium RL_2_7]
KVFRSNLQDYTNQDGYDLYDERVFPISALQALRDRIKHPESDLAGTGMPEFVEALNTFLTQERVIAEFRQARTMARQVSAEVSESINLRVPLLNQSLQELQARIDAVQPEFDKLSDIGERFREEIHRTRDRQARGIADSFKAYILDLPKTFDEDFTQYQPSNIGFLDYFSQGQREAFEKAFEKAFERYLKDKISSWVGQAEKDLEVGLQYLRTVADEYGHSYQMVTDEMTQKLTGDSFKAPNRDSEEVDVPGWAKWAMGLYSVAAGNFAGATLAMGGFDFNTIFINLIAALSVSFLASVIFGVMLGPITFALVGLGLGALQVEQGRKKFVQLTQKEFSKHLPKLAEEQWQPIYSTVTK